MNTWTTLANISANGIVGAAGIGSNVFVVGKFEKYVIYILEREYAKYYFYYLQEGFLQTLSKCMMPVLISGGNWRL